MFSWEYPPLSYGGLARHVQDLSEALVKLGHSIFIITQGDNNIPVEQNINGVKVFRTERVKISAGNFSNDILHLNFQLLEKAIAILDKYGDMDIVHGHDWLVFWASKVIKHSKKIPLIYTIHATEHGRNQGIYNELQRYINDIEWYSTYEAWRVIVCSNYMKEEVKNIFYLPDDKIKKLKNGVVIERFETKSDKEFRNNYAAPGEKIVFFVGRIVREKGIQILISAIPDILKENPSTKFIISGKGPHLKTLRQQANNLDIADRIFFTGFIDDEVRNKLYKAADIAVFPSLYEPFGIVALEAMATKTAVVLSDVGGFSEIIKNEKNGLKVAPNNSLLLAEDINKLFNNKKLSKRIAKQGYEMVKNNYDWEVIAQKTLRIYENVLKEYDESDWNNNFVGTYNVNEKKFANYRYML